MPMNELEMFLSAWDREAENTLKLLRALPVTQYHFRPDAGGRSLGELAWHLAESDAYMSHGIECGDFKMATKPPNIERPRTVEELAPGYERVHKDAVARIRKLKIEDLDRVIPFFIGRKVGARHPVGSNPVARHPSPRSAQSHVPSGRGTDTGHLRAQPRGDGRHAGACERIVVTLAVVRLHPRRGSGALSASRRAGGLDFRLKPDTTTETESATPTAWS